MTRPPLDCPGSLRPVLGLKPGDAVVCDFCGQEVTLVAPPASDLRDPWPRSKDARLMPHPSPPTTAGRRA